VKFYYSRVIWPSTPGTHTRAVLGLAALLLTWVVGCIDKDPTLTDDDTADDDTSECIEAESLIVDVFVEGQAWCEQEMPGYTTCFDCHFCGVTEAAEVSKTHFTCNFCHNGPNGEILDETTGMCGCEGLDCANPPENLGCDECHTDGCNGYVSAQVQRDHCLYCHTGTGEPPR